MQNRSGIFSATKWLAIERRGHLLEFETVVAELSSGFINCPPDEMDGEIEVALRRICVPLGIDFAVLWLLTGDDRAVPTHVYCAEPGLQVPESLHQELFPWYRQKMLAGRLVVISSLDELPPEAAVDRENARLFGIKSNLAVPLLVGGEPPVGALVLNTVLAEREWTDLLVSRLQLVAQVFTNALARRRRDQRLQASETRLAAGAELAGLGFYEIDFAENAIYVDDRLRHLCGIPAEQERGLDALAFWMDHLHPDDRKRVLDMRQQLQDGRLDRLSIEYRYRPPGHADKWIQHRAGVTRRDASGRALRTYGVLRDVTERKQVENEMLDLSRRLIRAHEEERALLARELHDDVTQRLAVLAIEVGRAELAAPEGAQAAAMQQVRDGLVRLSEDVHSLAYQLHPSILRELGLAEALRAECERRVRQGRLDVSVTLDPLPVVASNDAALCLYRVAQEALNNVARHAGVHAASVTLRKMDGGLLLSVHDDGVGFALENPRKQKHFGLASMRERVRLVNGTLDIESAPSRGTTIIAWVPEAGELQ